MPNPLISKPWVSLGKGVCLELTKLTINQHLLRSYYYFHSLFNAQHSYERIIICITEKFGGKGQIQVHEESSSD